MPKQLDFMKIFVISFLFFYCTFLYGQNHFSLLTVKEIDNTFTTIRGMFDRMQLDSARQLISATQIASVRLRYSSGIAEAYSHQTKLYLYQQKIDSSIFFAKKTIEYGKKAHFWQAIGDGYKFWGTSEMMLSHFSAARSYYDSATAAYAQMPMNTLKEQEWATKHRLSILNQQGNICLLIGDRISAEKYYTTLLNHYIKKEDKLNITKLYYNLSVLYTRVNNVKALNYINNALKFAHKVNSNEYICKSNLLQVEIYSEMGNIPQAFVHLRSAIKYCKKMSLNEIYFYTKLTEGTLWVKIGKVDSAQAAYLEARNIAKKLQSSSLTQLLQIPEAALYEDIGKIDSAIILLRKNMIYAQQSEDWISYTEAARLLAKIYTDLKDYNNANYYYNTYFDKNKKILFPDSSLYALALSSYGNMLGEQKNIHKAILLNKKALRIMQRNETFNTYCDILHTTVKWLRISGYTQIAYDSAMTGLRLAHRIGYTTTESALSLEIARILKQMNRISDAIRYAERADTLVQKNNIFTNELEIVLFLSDLYEKINDYNKAANVNKRAYLLHERLSEHNAMKTLAQYRILLETDRLSAEKVAEAARADSNRRALGWAIVALAVAVAAIGVFVWLNRRLHRQNEVIEQQRAKLAVSNREVHHNLSNQLQAIKSQIANQSSYNKHVEVQNVLREMATRVEAIQFLHATLYQQGDIQQVENVGEYLTEICDSVQYVFNKEKNIALTIDFATLSLSPKRAEDVAIFLNEALTNAYKYAFEGGIAAPKIAVSLRVAGDSLCLEIRDNGNGFPEKIDNITENPRSFGTYLLQSRAKTLGGTLLRYNDSGAVVCLTIPLAE